METKSFIASIVHVGYEASTNDFINDINITQSMDRIILNPRPYTAFRFNHSALSEGRYKQCTPSQRQYAVNDGRTLNEWFLARRGKEKFFIVKKIHIKTNNVKDFWQNLVVLEGSIDGEPTYMTANKHNYKPIQVKRMVNSGLQPHISSHTLDEFLKIPVKAYRFTADERFSY